MRVSPAAKISELARAWRVLGTEQRVAAVGSLLLIVSTFGPFTFVEAAVILTAVGVLLLLKRRADGYEFHLPFGDGTAITAAGVWCAILIVIRMFDRPLGQGLLALACAALVIGAGLRERAKRPMDDLPADTIRIRRNRTATEPIEWDDAPTSRIPRDDPPTTRIPPDAAVTERLRRRGSGTPPR